MARRLTIVGGSVKCFWFGPSGAEILCAHGALGRRFWAAPLNFTVRAHLQRQTPGGNPTLEGASFQVGPD